MNDIITTREKDLKIAKELPLKLGFSEWAQEPVSTKSQWKSSAKKYIERTRTHRSRDTKKEIPQSNKKSYFPHKTNYSRVQYQFWGTNTHQNVQSEAHPKPTSREQTKFSYSYDIRRYEWFPAGCITSSSTSERVVWTGDIHNVNYRQSVEQPERAQQVCPAKTEISDISGLSSRDLSIFYPCRGYGSLCWMWQGCQVWKNVSISSKTHCTRWLSCHS